ncbi:MAG: alpha-1,2-fucosyltransferase [Candidatus Vogelbacteria bacterium CG10_big_fil_rev_8_21_14_0_10_49_38]|uniref:Alpha-1,2-fucosyltransferase n=1 Tax=Candidatus Vogelbacteria bacterium CG10_big_fil_rev_8_21_14_0_10_49_38 TaxID=1975043 RepID=A0A2H0RI39_9BACT|nr:MAG: hypothetical protein BK006_01655 [bacterium CG10_49_38]PIR46100.1 MAG: alpha-1,2-fucosyltransferase [Candidatus Vogelbacteria bacterium CG10_big_fil_rev_8_21_14_0_10_49_38]
MIITQLTGGLGNQLFQYACGRALSLSNGDVLKLDLGNYAQENSARQYQLGHFGIEEQIASPEEIAKVRRQLPVISRLIRAFRFRILKVEYVSFKPHLLKKTGDVYLEGYWQSEKYFSSIADTIRQDFRLKDGMGSPADRVAQEISQEKWPVSLHLRRGDYVADPKTKALLNICSPAYYQKAIDLMLRRYPDSRFFVFSDDIEWAKANLLLPTATDFVSAPEIMDYEELILMSYCHHHIIANSSFSWWGAWLNSRTDKIVVAPLVWSRGRKSKKIYKDIIPESWIRI